MRLLESKLIDRYPSTLKTIKLEMLEPTKGQNNPHVRQVIATGIKPRVALDKKTHAPLECGSTIITTDITARKYTTGASSAKGEETGLDGERVGRWGGGAVSGYRSISRRYHGEERGGHYTGTVLYCIHVNFAVR